MPGPTNDFATEWLRASVTGRPVEVDRKNAILRGFVVAQAGPFKSRRGEFDRQSLQEIADAGNGAGQGLKSRFSHPTECNDGLGKYLGRARNFGVGTVKLDSGQIVDAVRADLHFDATALQSGPQGGKPLGEYVMDLAESDAGAVSSSLVIRPKKEYRLDSSGLPLKDEKGEPLPPLWRVEKLIATDIVDIGDAVDGLLSAELPNSYLWAGADMIDRLFPDATFEELQSRLQSWLDKYLSERFGTKATPGVAADRMNHLIRRQKMRESQSRALTDLR